MDDLIEEALKEVPPEVNQRLRGWIRDAQTGNSGETEAALLHEVETYWERFELALKKLKESMDA